MRIAIVTSRRFHLLDLARELAALGHAVQFFSCVSRARARRAGLPMKSYRGLFRTAFPILALQRFGPERWSERFDPYLQRVVDRAAARRLGRCDIVIGLSGTCVRCFQKARNRFKAKLFLERGGRHILSQKDILEQIPGWPRPAVAHAEIKREIWGYSHANVVVVASRHAEESFLERGVEAGRLFRNPYGVDLEKFSPTARLPREIPTILYVGSWSTVNGCDLLAQAVRGKPWKVVHIGPKGDAPRPMIAHFERREMAEDWDLCQIFRNVDLLVRPSRGEGMGMVQAQALASGVPVVCTDRSGGEDLREFVDDPESIIVVKAGNLETLCEGIRKGMALAFTQSGPRCFLTKGREFLSWPAYGLRYDRELRRPEPVRQAAASAVVPMGFPLPQAPP